LAGIEGFSWISVAVKKKLLPACWPCIGEICIEAPVYLALSAVAFTCRCDLSFFTPAGGDLASPISPLLTLMLVVPSMFCIAFIGLIGEP